MTEPVSGEFMDALRAFAQMPVLLVASDYDGVVAPIVDNPRDAKPLGEAIEALCDLAACTNTHVAVVSGRSRSDLTELSGLSAPIHLVGSHGSEFGDGFAQELTAQQLELRAKILSRFNELAKHDPEFEVETKPASIAFHYRRVHDRDLADRVVDEIAATIAAEPGVEVKLGKQVVELAVLEADKGTALDTLRQQVSADAVFFMGDDVTDEDAFRTLKGSDVAIKIGPGVTVATFRLSAPEDAARVLALLWELRTDWLSQAAAPG